MEPMALKPISEVVNSYFQSITKAKSLCEQCGKRPSHNDKKWCWRCIAAWDIQKYAAGPSVAISGVVPERFRTAKMSDFSAAVQEAISSLGDNEDLFLWGQVGVGKSHLVAAAIIERLCSGWNVYRTRFGDMLTHVRSTYQTKADQTEEEVIKEYVKKDLLVIEDIGSTTSKEETDFSVRILTDVLDNRQEHLRPTWLTSNKSLDEIGKTFDARIKSRLSMGRVLCLQGKDRRVRA
jgi:DNA replication protein DnaC